MQMRDREEVLLQTKYLLEPSEESQFQIAGMPEDMRGAFEYEAEEWINDIEPFFTVPEIMEIFQ